MSWVKKWMTAEPAWAGRQDEAAPSPREPVLLSVLAGILIASALIVSAAVLLA